MLNSDIAIKNLINGLHIFFSGILQSLFNIIEFQKLNLYVKMSDKIKRCEQLFGKCDLDKINEYIEECLMWELTDYSHAVVQIITLSDVKFLQIIKPGERAPICGNKIELKYCEYLLEYYPPTKSFETQIRDYIKTGEPQMCDNIFKLAFHECLIVQVLTGQLKELPVKQILANMILKKLNIPRIKKTTNSDLNDTLKKLNMPIIKGDKYYEYHLY